MTGKCRKLIVIENAKRPSAFYRIEIEKKPFKSNIDRISQQFHRQLQ